MKLLFSLFLTLCSTVVLGQGITPLQLDSLKAVVKGSGETQPRIEALRQVLYYYGLMPKVDSVLTYSDYGLAHIAQDSSNIYTILIYKNLLLGRAMDLLGDYKTAKGYHEYAKQNISLFKRKLLNENASILKLNQIENTVKNNLALSYTYSHEYIKSDSCYVEMLSHARTSKDTVTIILVLINRAMLYDRMASELEKDSALFIQQELMHFIDDGILLSRTYLLVHPEDVKALRFLMYLLANKANLVSRDSQVVVDVKKVLLENLLEAIKLAQTKGYPGQDLLVCKTEIINLYRVLKRYEKAFETADEVIKESKSLGLNETEGNGYAKRIDIRWDLKQYKEGIADVYLAEEAYRVAKHYAGLILLCEETAERLGELPLLQRYKFRQERARFEAKAKEYRQQAKEAGQEVPEAKP